MIRTAHPGILLAAPTTRFEVRWADVDANRHLRNTAYSEYATHARLKYLVSCGFDPGTFERLRFGPVIFREEVRYRREIGFGDSFDIDLRLGGLADDGSQWRMVQRFRRADGVEAARLVVEGAWINLDTRRLVSPTAELLSALRRLPADEDSCVMPSLLEQSPEPALRLDDRRGHSPPPTKARTSSTKRGQAGSSSRSR
jgi:acyl-CoA thioester hydrolase